MEITSLDVFLSYLGNVRARTERVLDCVPSDMMEWRPHDAAFSFGDVIRHLGAIERWMFAENVQGLPSRYPGHGVELADGVGPVRDYLRRMHEESVHIFRGLTADQLAGRCRTPGGAAVPVWKWLRSMIEHEVHHRGQVYLMLALLRVPTPPLYGLTSEEVHARSLAP